MKKKSILWLRVLVLLIFPLSVSAKEKGVEVLGQEKMGENACGPCAFVNSLLQARDVKSLSFLKGATPLLKAQDFAARYGKAPSLSYGKGRSAYTEAGGVTDRDLLAMVNSFRKDRGKGKDEGGRVRALAGEHLVRKSRKRPGLLPGELGKRLMNPSRLVFLLC